MNRGGLYSLDARWFVEDAPCQSPTLDGRAILFEDCLRRGLGKIIAELFIGRTLDNGELLAVVGVPEPVPLSQEVLGAAGDALVCSQIVARTPFGSRGSSRPNNPQKSAST